MAHYSSLMYLSTCMKTLMDVRFVLCWLYLILFSPRTLATQPARCFGIVAYALASVSLATKDLVPVRHHAFARSAFDKRAPWFSQPVVAIKGDAFAKNRSIAMNGRDVMKANAPLR